MTKSEIIQRLYLKTVSITKSCETCPKDNISKIIFQMYQSEKDLVTVNGKILMAEQNRKLVL